MNPRRNKKASGKGIAIFQLDHMSFTFPGNPLKNFDHASDRTNWLETSEESPDLNTTGKYKSTVMAATAKHVIDAFIRSARLETFPYPRNPEISIQIKTGGKK